MVAPDCRDCFDYFASVREPWSDILWARFISPLLSGRPPEEGDRWRVNCCKKHC